MYSSVMIRSNHKQYIQWIQEDKLKLINQSINSTDIYEPQEANNERWKVSHTQHRAMPWIVIIDNRADASTMLREYMRQPDPLIALIKEIRSSSKRYKR